MTKIKSRSTHPDGHVKQSAGKLRKSEERYRDIVNHINDGVYQLDSKGRFTYVNKIIVERSKISEEKFYTLHYFDIVSPEDRERVQKNFMKVMRGKRVGPYEVNIKTPNGRTITVEINTRPIYEGKRIVGHQGISRDITTRKEIESALKASETQFRSLIENIPVGIIIYEGTKIRYLNPACERITGHTRSELYLLDIWEIAHSEFKDAVREYVVRQHRKEPVPELHAVKIITKSGEERWVERGAIAIELKGKTSVLVTIMDITERRYAEEALRRSEEKYRAILENASDAILLADEHGNVIEANRMAEELLGYTREEFLLMHYTQLHPMMELEKTTAAFKNIVTNGQGVLQNGAMLRKDGTVIPVDITAHAIEYHGRKVFQASFRDISAHAQVRDTLESLVKGRTAELSEKNNQLIEEITERKRAEAALRKKSKELRLHANKHQELNTALKILLKQREEDKRELEEKIMANVKELLLPYLEELKKGRLDARSKVQVSILEANLKNIISPFTYRISSKYSGFTPREIQVANLVRQGQSTKDIAEYVGVSQSAINLYRNNIRSKLGIISRKINLRSHLMSLS